MAEDLKGLIEKIQIEGVKAAQDKARELEEAAKSEASIIIDKARREAEKIISQAREETARLETSGKESLKQAGRDLILNLRKEITSMLDKIIAAHVHKVLSAEEMVRLISAMIKSCAKETTGEIVVCLKKDDVEKLERGLLTELKNEVKKGIVLKTSDEIQGGFLISYDSGKSYYDFTDKALAGYLMSNLGQKLAEILN